MADSTILSGAAANGTAGTWSARYGERHQQTRITEFPAGITGPQTVRIYRRRDHYILQWWDKRERRTRSDRVNGDLVAAIMRAREIEARLESFRTGGVVSRRRLAARDLVGRYCTDLAQRAEAGEIDPGTVCRYTAALDHYLNYAELPKVAAAYPSAGHVDREFALGFTAYLSELRVAPNGHPNAATRRLAAPRYIEAVVRALFAWAADPDRGNLLSSGFRSPFSGTTRRTGKVAEDLFGEPDITIPMAAEFLAACDPVQLPLLATILLYGLRAAEPCYLFREDLDLQDGWLRVPCRPELGYLTKGRRDKRLPLLPPLSTLLEPASSLPPTGLLFLRRPVLEGRERPPLLGATAAELAEEYERRCRRQGRTTAGERQHIRKLLLKEAGGQTYDQIADEFRAVAGALGWPAVATAKDLRHLAATAFENAGMPLFSRKYLLGQSPGRGAIVHYTHVNELRRHYEDAAEKVLGPLFEATKRRGQELGLLATE